MLIKKKWARALGHTAPHLTVPNFSCIYLYIVRFYSLRLLRPTRFVPVASWLLSFEVATLTRSALPCVAPVIFLFQPASALEINRLRQKLPTRFHYFAILFFYVVGVLYF